MGGSEVAETTALQAVVAQGLPPVPDDGRFYQKQIKKVMSDGWGRHYYKQPEQLTNDQKWERFTSNRIIELIAEKTQKCIISIDRWRAMSKDVMLEMGMTDERIQNNITKHPHILWVNLCLNNIGSNTERDKARKEIIKKHFSVEECF